jgi:hypothetical protein
MNYTFTANLKNCHGQYSETQVSRCSKIVGSVGKSIESIFQEVIQDYVPRASSSDGSSISKIKKFVEEYRSEDLFKDKNAHRHHHGFAHFKHQICVKNPDKLHFRLKKYVKALENEEFLYE